MLKNAIRSGLRRAGYELKRVRESEAARLGAMLRAHGVNLVFDVGANIGQFGTQLRAFGYGGRIVSFEPLAEAHRELAKACARDPLWELGPRGALGSEDGEIEIHVSSNSQSSSPLDMLPSHLGAAPESRYVGAERATVRRLDALAPGYLRPESVPFLKIDTQGYEGRVLDGARETLPRAVGIQLELSLVPLYKGQRLFDEMLRRVEECGFELWSISPVMVEPATGRTLQVDATLFRR